MLRVILVILALTAPAAADTVIDMPRPPRPVAPSASTTYENRGADPAELPPGALALDRWAGGRDAPQLSWLSVPDRGSRRTAWWWDTGWGGSWWWSGRCLPFHAGRHVHHRPRHHHEPPGPRRRSPFASPPTTFRTSREP